MCSASLVIIAAVFVSAHPPFGNDRLTAFLHNLNLVKLVSSSVVVTRLWPQPKLHHKGHKEHKDFSLCALWPRGEKNLRGCDSFSGVI